MSTSPLPPSLSALDQFSSASSHIPTSPEAFFFPPASPPPASPPPPHIPTSSHPPRPTAPAMPVAERAGQPAPVLVPAPPPLPASQAHKPPLARPTRRVRKSRKPHSPAAASNAAALRLCSPGSAAAAAVAVAAATTTATATATATGSKTSLRKSSKPQPFLRLIDNLCNIYAAANAPVTATTKRERNAAHAKKSDLKASKYVEVLEKVAIAAANLAPPPPSCPPSRNPPASAAAAAAAASSTSPGAHVVANTSPASPEKEKNKLNACVSRLDQPAPAKSPSTSADKHQQQHEQQEQQEQQQLRDEHKPQRSSKHDERNDTSRDGSEITASTDVVKSTVSDAMSMSSSAGTNSVTRSCRCPDVCKKDDSREDVCLCDVPDSLCRIIYDVFPFANKLGSSLSTSKSRLANGNSPPVPKCEKQIVKHTVGAEVPAAKPQTEGNITPSTEDDPSNTTSIRSIPSLPRSDRSLSRMISLNPSSKQIDNIPSLSQIVAAGVSMALDTPPDYKNKFSLFAAAAGSGASSLPKSGNAFMPDGVENDLLGRNEVVETGDEKEDNAYSSKKQVNALCANPSPHTVQTILSPFVQEVGSSATPDLYLSPNRWDFGFNDHLMLAASDEGSMSLFMRRSPREDTPMFANFVSPNLQE